MKLGLGRLLLGAALFAAAPAALPAEEHADSRPATVSADTPTTFDFPKAGDTRVAGIEEIKSMLADHGSDLLVVNFWATWCGPCVEEMPYFVRVSKEYPTKKVRFVGLSADLKKDVESKVIPFLRDREIPYSNLVVFADQMEVINLFSEEWGGDIPVTFFYNKEGEKVGEVLTSVTYEELKDLVEEHLPG